MSELVVVAYDDEYRAAEVFAALKRLESEYLVDLDDAVYVTKSRDGKVRLHGSDNLTAAGAVGGAFWGLLTGALFLVPIAGLAVGAGLGALGGHVADAGLEDTFIRELSGRLGPGSSALFMLVRASRPERVVPELAQFGGEILQTSLPPDAEERLQASLRQPGAV